MSDKWNTTDSTSYLINMFSIQTKISWKRTKVFELFSRKNSNYNMNSWNDLLCHEKISNLLNEFGCQHDHTDFLKLTKPLNWHWLQWPTSGAWWPPWWSHDLWFYCTLGQCAIFCPLQGCMWNTLAIGTFIEALVNSRFSALCF